MKLYHCRDSRSLRPLWALEEMGIPYQLEDLPFPPRLFRKEYLGINPLGTGAVLRRRRDPHDRVGRDLPLPGRALPPP